MTKNWVARHCDKVELPQVFMHYEFVHVQTVLENISNVINAVRKTRIPRLYAGR